MFVGEINYKHFADSRTGSSRAYKSSKRTLVTGKEELNFKIYNKANSANIISKLKSHHASLTDSIFLNDTERSTKLLSSVMLISANWIKVLRL